MRDMVDASQGRILFTSSIASTMPGPYRAVYNASKSFVKSFALALRNELKDTGVSVTVLMPGPTDTEFFERADFFPTASRRSCTTGWPSPTRLERRPVAGPGEVRDPS